MKKTAVVMMAIVASVQFAFAQKPSIVTSNEEGWQKIGETTVSFKEEDESIVVMGADEFSALKLKVTDAPIKIERLQVFYESGEMQELDVESELNAGSETSEFQLDHKNRDIQKVAFTYKSTANGEGERAHVELHGLKTDAQNPSDAYRNERDRAGAEIDSAAQDVEDAAENVDNAARDTENAMDRAGEEIDSAATEAGQELNDQAENIEDDVEDGADRVRSDVEAETDSATNEVAETTANTASGIADEISKDKEGPEGQTIYMERSKKYYYINEDGKKVFIGKEQLKDKKKE
jgi:F0F1-type ATP synthase membrane subunit b/b'